jgi:hypothetical protein
MVAECELKSPFFPPFSKGEFSPWASHPSLEKRGRGDFFGGIEAGNYVANFSYRTLSALDDGAALFAPIAGDSGFHCF